MAGSSRRLGRMILLAAVVVAAVSHEACNAIVGPSAPDSNWRVLERGRFTFFVRPGSFCEQHVDSLAKVLDDQYDHTVALLRLRYEGHITEILYDWAADGDFKSNRGGAGYPMTETVRAVCSPPLDDNLYALLAHETNHVIVINGMGRAGTHFMTEGIASALLSERYFQLGPRFLFGWTLREMSRIPALASLTDDGRWSGFDSHVAYNASASFVAYLLEIDEPDRLRQLYGATSRDFADRFARVYGRSLAQAEVDWKAYCARVAG